jgi:hypothetical protein
LQAFYRILCLQKIVPDQHGLPITGSRECWMNTAPGVLGSTAINPDMGGRNEARRAASVPYGPPDYITQPSMGWLVVQAAMPDHRQIDARCSERQLLLDERTYAHEVIRHTPLHYRQPV